MDVRSDQIGLMPHAATKLPRLRPSQELSNLLSEIASEQQFDAAKRHVDRFFAQDDQAFEGYATVVRSTVEDMIKLLEAGAAVDVEDLVDSLLDAERRDQAQRRSIEREAEKVFREISRRRPDAMPLTNKTVQSFLGRVDRLAELHRDARWRLMTARAQYQPSRGEGPVHGLATDADEYLKTSS